jgi:hypothetical protein
MSIGMVLEATRDWLRARNSWKFDQCGVCDEGYPFEKSGQLFVGIDEDGVTAGPANTYGLTETFQLSIAVWRRPGHLPKDMYDQMVIPEDRYLPELSTLHQLERRVMFWLHHRWEFLNYINEKYKLPDAGRGDKFTEALTFAGSSKKEVYVVREGVAYMGRRLRFRGLKRIQKITSDLG